MKNTYINHVVFAIDASGSMESLREQVSKVFDSQIAYLAKRSKEVDQETRVSVYMFNERTTNIIYDRDCLRLGSIKDSYRPMGGTALIDATILSIEDLEKTATLYGDHSFLIYVLTDGMENRSVNTPDALKNKLQKLADNWTVAVFVPNALGISESKKFGFPADNIAVWSTTQDGLDEVGEVMKKATDSYFTARSTGVRGTKNLFNLNPNLSKAAVVNNLTELDPKTYQGLIVRKDGIDIKSFVESWKIPFRLGSNYFQLTKPEKVQASKNILVKNKMNGKVFYGSEARNLLGLPNHEVKVAPASFQDFDIFVQSTSVNRKLVKDTMLIVLN
jgi:acetolactate synthase regulatory subunit